MMVHDGTKRRKNMDEIMLKLLMTAISLLSLYIINISWLFSIRNKLNGIEELFKGLTDLEIDQFKILFKSQESMQKKLDSIKEILKDNSNDTKRNGSI